MFAKWKEEKAQQKWSVIFLLPRDHGSQHAVDQLCHIDLYHVWPNQAEKAWNDASFPSQQFHNWHFWCDFRLSGYVYRLLEWASQPSSTELGCRACASAQTAAVQHLEVAAQALTLTALPQALGPEPQPPNAVYTAAFREPARVLSCFGSLTPKYCGEIPIDNSRVLWNKGKFRLKSTICLPRCSSERNLGFHPSPHQVLKNFPLSCSECYI